MKARQLFAAAAVVAAASVLPAAAAGPDSGAKSAIAGAVAATNSNDPSKIGSYFASDAVIVDENAPFVWKGANAGAAWWKTVQQSIAGGSMHAAAGPLVEFRMDKASANAYAVVPLHITVAMKGRTVRESGLWAVTLHRFGGDWKITTASWATSRR